MRTKLVSFFFQELSNKQKKLRLYDRRRLKQAQGGPSLKSRRQYYVSVIQPHVEYGSTASSSSLSAREKARLLQASRKGICAIARALDSNDAASEDFWTCTTVSAFLIWSCCSSHIDVCTLLPALFFVDVASTNWKLMQTARTAQHVLKHFSLSVFLQSLAALVNSN